MRVAIATFRQQVSPRFDCANAALLVDLEEGRETERRTLPLNAVPPYARAGFLREQSVQVLLCGGLRRRDYHELAASGIEVIAGLFGEVEEILAAYREGRLQPQALGNFTPPFGRGWQHRNGPGGQGRHGFHGRRR